MGCGLRVTKWSSSCVTVRKKTVKLFRHALALCGQAGVDRQVIFLSHFL